MKPPYLVTKQETYNLFLLHFFILFLGMKAIFNLKFMNDSFYPNMIFSTKKRFDEASIHSLVPFQSYIEFHLLRKNIQRLQFYLNLQ